MAFRFRRSIKLGKGLRMNVSKRGVGMSFGTTGLRSSIHSTGSRTNTIGIPGTGLSYVNRSYKKKRRKPTSQSDPSVNQSPSENEAIVEQYERYIHELTHTHQNTPQPIAWVDIQHTPEPFSKGETGPRQQEAIQNYDQYSPSFLERVFSNLADKKKQELTQAIHQAKQKDEKEYHTWQEETAFAESVLDGSPLAYEQVVQKSKNFDEMRDRIQMRVIDSRTVEANVQVAPGDIVPKKNIQLTKTGRVSKRKMEKKAYFAIVQAFVCGHALWTARSLFASLPIGACMIHMTDSPLNKRTGHYEERVLLSVLFDRQTMDRLNFSFIHPFDAMYNFQHQMEFLKTKGLRSVKRLTL